MFADLKAIDVFAAQRRIAAAVRHTPLRRCYALGEIAGAEIYLKREFEQITGSFKLRGAFNAIAMMSADERARGVVASSAGNHGLGVAYAARHFGVQATIFIPSSAPAIKKDGIVKLGATVDDSQPDYDAAMVKAKALAATRGSLFINPCLGTALLAGQGTVGLEILESLPEVGSIVLPVGGGGLLGGVASLVRRVAPHVRIIGAQSVKTAAMADSLAAGRLVEIPSVPTIAEGLAGQIDDEALDIGRHAMDECITLDEDRIAEAIAWLSTHEGATVEGAGAVSVAAVLFKRIHTLIPPVAVVVSGGNIDSGRHADIMRTYAFAHA
jgi:threonine dehydratase